MTKINKQTYKLNNVKYKKNNGNLIAKLKRLYLQPKQELSDLT